MFRMRPEHLAAFEQVSIEDFEDRMVEHLCQSFPDKCKDLGEPALRQTIRHGIDRAEAYQLEEEDDVCLYLDLMLELGRDFDKDPKHAWATAMLKDPADDPSDRIERVWEQVFEPETDEGEE